MMNPEELIAMFSEELYIMDRNTERPMVTEPQEKNAALEEEVKALEENKALADKKSAWRAAFNMPLEEALAIFSEGLRIMDRNTERLMVEELQAEHAALQAEYADLQAQNAALRAKKAALQTEYADLIVDYTS